MRGALVPAHAESVLIIVRNKPFFFFLSVKSGVKFFNIRVTNSIEIPCNKTW